MQATANPLLRARADLASSHAPPVQCGLGGPAVAARLSGSHGLPAGQRDYPAARPVMSQSVTGRTRSRGCCRDGSPPAERAVYLVDRAAARFKADEPEGE